MQTEREKFSTWPLTAPGRLQGWVQDKREARPSYQKLHPRLLTSSVVGSAKGMDLPKPP